MNKNTAMNVMNNSKIEMTLDRYTRKHYHLVDDSQRCPHHVCLRILAVDNMPEETRTVLQKRMHALIDTYYHTPRDGWARIWMSLQHILVSTLPPPVEDSPAWVQAVQKIISDP